jgi:hypothetical protein
MVEKFLISRDDSLYHAWPDVTIAPEGALLCVFTECTHHGDRSYTRIMLCRSTDRGRTWSGKQPITEPLRGRPPADPYWNCARIGTLSDGSIYVLVDRIQGREQQHTGRQETLMLLSPDAGRSWSAPAVLPMHGIVPDRLIELKRGRHAGRWVISCHANLPTGDGQPGWFQRCWLSDDRGRTWSEPVVIAHRPDLQLCEGSVCELPGGELVCLMRENSWRGLDAFKSVSRDGGKTWSPPVEFPLPGCHRPVVTMLHSGEALITYRFAQGGKGWVGWYTQNTMAALASVESLLAERRADAQTRILPLDFDRSPQSDGGYTGAVQFDDGEIYVVNYIVDDAPKGQIRGYALRRSDFIIEGT